MIHASTIRALLTHQPFRPFVVTLNDGNRVAVTDPDLAFIALMELNLYAPPPEGESIPRHLDRIIAMANVTSVELQPQSSA